MLHYFVTLVPKYAKPVLKNVKNMRSTVWSTVRPARRNVANVRKNAGLWLELMLNNILIKTLTQNKGPLPFENENNN